jgi:hypothetical protein
MQINGIEGMSADQIRQEVRNGGRFVIFQYVISILIMSFNRPSDIYFVRADEKSWNKGIGHTILSFFLGWWGFPWGLIYTPMAIYTNLMGGKDVTNEVLSSIGQSSPPQTAGSGGYNIPGTHTSGGDTANGGYNIPGAPTHGGNTGGGGYNIPNTPPTGGDTGGNTGPYNIPR